MALQALEFTRTVGAPAAEAYRALTRSTPLREWLCDVALADARVGGRIYLWWNSGYYTAGEFTALEQDRSLSFTWQGRGEPGMTQVRVHLAPAAEGTSVTVVHSGIAEGDEWKAARDEYTRGWKSGLENLQSVLETGQDLRFTRRPMMGVNLEDFNAEIAGRLGVPVAEGNRLGGVLEGMGAAAAGLRADDVIVSLRGKQTRNWPELVSALQGCRAGDVVEASFYRGPELLTTRMTLSPRPLPEIPPTAAALSDKVGQINAEALGKLEAVLAGVSDARAAAKPAPDSWSAMETLAHLVISEREAHAWITDLINDDERWADRFENSTNVPARIGAVLSVCPTLGSMLDELKCAVAETEAMVAALPPEFRARKGTYWRLGHNLLLGGEHWNEHLEQVKAALEAAAE